MAVLDLQRFMPRRRAIEAPNYTGASFMRFFNSLLTYGLEHFGLYYGVYRAEVVSTDDPETDGQPDPFGRLHVRVRAVGDRQDVSRLAWPVLPLAGDGYGFKAIPPAGGYCYVVFQNGSLDSPLWLGGWWRQNELPDDLGAIETHGFITPGGHKVILNSKEGEDFVKIEHSAGATIEIDSQGAIFIRNASGQKVNVGDGADTANEPALLGTTTKDIISQLIDAILAMTVTTPMGPSGTAINAGQFAALKGQLQRILSQTVNVK